MIKLTRIICRGLPCCFSKQTKSLWIEWVVCYICTWLWGTEVNIVCWGILLWVYILLGGVFCWRVYSISRCLLFEGIFYIKVFSIGVYIFRGYTPVICVSICVSCPEVVYPSEGAGVCLSNYHLHCDVISMPTAL